jgi:hypothetical protein
MALNVRIPIPQLVDNKQVYEKIQVAALLLQTILFNQYIVLTVLNT